MATIPQNRVTIRQLAREMGVSANVLAYHCRRGHLTATARLIQLSHGPVWTVTRVAGEKFKEQYVPWGRK